MDSKRLILMLANSIRSNSHRVRIVFLFFFENAKRNDRHSTIFLSLPQGSLHLAQEVVLENKHHHHKKIRRNLMLCL